MARRYTAGNIMANAAQRSREELEHVGKNHFSSFLLLVFYIVGVIGILIPIHSSFILLTPFMLLISLCIVLYNHVDWNVKTIVFLISIFVMGLSVEIIGVRTGLVFGNYEYGEVLGPKVMGTPLMIGVNWLILIYCCGAALNQFLSKRNVFFKSFIGALSLVSLDLLIEPVAMIHGFWSWGEDNLVPLQNYLAWFIISFVFLLLFNLALKDMKNNAALTLFNLQFIFFLVLGIDWF